MHNKVQKVIDGTNVIVELENSPNQNFFHENKRFKNPVVLSDNEILEIAEKCMSRGERLAYAKDFVSKMDGHGKAQAFNDEIKSGDIVKFELE